MSVNQDLVSIVIVAYNNWPDLELAIQSALCQSYRNVEVIVIDNSSTDGTQEELKQRFDTRIRYIRQSNRRDSGAYNAGMDVAKGSFIQFLDGDDVLAPYKIEKQVDYLSKNIDVDIAFGDVRSFLTAPGHASFIEQSPRYGEKMREGFLTRYGQGMIHWVALLFRRSALDRIGSFDETLYATDVEFELRAHWLGCRFGYCPGNPLAFYRTRPGQMSANTRAMQEGQEEVWRRTLSYVDKEPFLSAVRSNLAWHQYLRAVNKLEMSTKDAIAKLLEARHSCANTISIPIFVIGLITVVLPFGGNLARLPMLRSLRRNVAKAVKCRPYWET